MSIWRRRELVGLEYWKAWVLVRQPNNRLAGKIGVNEVLHRCVWPMAEAQHHEDGVRVIQCLCTGKIAPDVGG